MEVALREVVEEDLPTFFEHQLDPAATAMASFPSRDREAFIAHWARILVDDSAVVRTIECDGQVTGNVVSWVTADERLVGYWIGRDHWGNGIATAALARFLEIVDERPLHALVSRHNVGSIRVLEKCGFARCGEDEEGFVYRINGPSSKPLS
jgi:RimJ/RimL family protein N-acetyltransferase